MTQVLHMWTRLNNVPPPTYAANWNIRRSFAQVLRTIPITRQVPSNDPAHPLQKTLNSRDLLRSAKHTLVQIATISASEAQSEQHDTHVARGQITQQTAPKNDQNRTPTLIEGEAQGCRPTANTKEKTQTLLLQSTAQTLPELEQHALQRSNPTVKAIMMDVEPEPGGRHSST